MQTIETLNSDHFTVMASTSIVLNPTSRKSYKDQLERKKVGIMKNLKYDNILNFFFLLDQKLKTVSKTLCTEMLVQMMRQKVFECFDKFAPEK